MFTLTIACVIFASAALESIVNVIVAWSTNMLGTEVFASSELGKNYLNELLISSYLDD